MNIMVYPADNKLNINPAIQRAMALYLIRYGELGLKSPGVRRIFERALRRNITSRYADARIECRIESDWGRIFLWSDDVVFTETLLSRTFGIVSFSRAEETDSSPESICNMAVGVAAPLFKEGMGFAVRARRKGQHPYTSMELARDTGSAIWLANEDKNPRVDLTNPELEIFVEVRQNRAFVYTEKVQGPRGMPLGTQGRVIGIVEKPLDIVACWLMMKRGCRVIAATSNPELVEPLRSWAPELKIMQLKPDLERLAKSQHAKGIVLGWDIAQYDAKHGEVDGLGVPVFYPLIGMAGADIEGLNVSISSAT